MDADRRIQDLKDRLTYIRDIFGQKEDDNIRLLAAKLNELLERESGLPGRVLGEELTRLEDLFDFRSASSTPAFLPWTGCASCVIPSVSASRTFWKMSMTITPRSVDAASSTLIRACSLRGPISPDG